MKLGVAKVTSWVAETGTQLFLARSVRLASRRAPVFGDVRPLGVDVDLLEESPGLLGFPQRPPGLAFLARGLAVQPMFLANASEGLDGPGQVKVPLETIARPSRQTLLEGDDLAIHAGG
jgi:hypothetical protein